jgi:hypothetical protein
VASKINILATIVMFNETLRNSSTWQSLYLNSLDHMSWLIINNGPSSIEIPRDYKGKIYEDLRNRGIASAYKKAIDVAQKYGYTHLLFLDQDTFFPDDFIQKLKICISDNPGFAVYCPTVYGQRYMLSPCRMRRGLGEAVTLDQLPEEIDFKHYSFINSGALFSISDLSEVWDDSILELFLDNVDHAIAHYLCIYDKKGVWYEVNVEQSYSGDSIDKEQILSRFRIWRRDAIVFGKISRSYLFQRYLIIKRKLHFFLRFRDWRFLK